MKISRFVPIAAALALLASCQKQQTDAERNADVERQVQERLAAERQAADQQRLAQQSADLDARERALADNEAAANQTPAATTTTTRRDTERETETRTRVARSQDEPEQSYDTFYRKLEPYGAWRETSAYGYVWQPRVAQQSRDWRPYTDGRWAYTDAGWTWVSDEPFGWATYHYGRWARLSGTGWVWVPGDEWAPAWVSWREGGDHVGWAPLPPEAHFEKSKGIKKWADSYYDIDADEYVFLPNEDIGAENVRQYALPPERNVAIVNQTTNVTDITYNNNVVINQGPSYDALRSRARQAPPRLRLEREYNVGNEAPGHAQIRGDTLAVVAPFVAAAVSANAKPRTEGAPITQTQVEHNWTRGNQADAQRARDKMRSEATPPSDAPAKRYDKPVITNAPPTATATPAPAATSAPPATASPTATARPTATAVATATPQSSATATATATAVATATPRATATATPTPTTPPRAVPAPTARQLPTATVAPETLATPEGQGSPLPRGGGVNERREQQRKAQEEWLRQHGAGPGASVAPTAPSRGVTPHANIAPTIEPTPAGIQLTPPPNPKQPGTTPTPFRRPQATPPPNESPTPAAEAASPNGQQNQPPPGRGRPRGGPRGQPGQTPSPSPTP